jgi:GNAT superfamily N-acetyltransferase
MRNSQQDAKSQAKDLPPHISIRAFSDKRTIEASQVLRYEVWSMAGAEISPDCVGSIRDSFDESALHWGAFEGERMVGSARLTIHKKLASAPDSSLFENFPIPCPVASINRMVILPEFRRLGIARAIDRLRIQEARASGCKAIIATPVQDGPSMARLSRYGFIALGVNGRAGWGNIPVTAAFLSLDEVRR